MICHELETVFVHIPKTAGQSIEEYYLNQIGLSWAKRRHIGVGILRGGIRSAHLYADELRELLTTENWNSYEKFSVVRNSWDRAASSWRYLCPHMTLDDFLDLYVKGCRRHGVSQSRFLKDFDGTVLRFEDLQHHFPNLPRRNVSERCEVPWTARGMRLIADTYAQDIERWGFDGTS